MNKARRGVGTTPTRTETRSLSPECKTMTIESVRGSSPPVVMVFDRRWASCVVLES
jgi:hypothetical protein